MELNTKQSLDLELLMFEKFNLNISDFKNTEEFEDKLIKNEIDFSQLEFFTNGIKSISDLKKYSLKNLKGLKNDSIYRKRD